MDKKQLAKFFDAKALKETHQRLNKMMGVERAVAGNDNRLQFQALPSFSIGLNHYLGGGYRRRKMHLVYGDKSSGKSFADYRTTAILQRLCRHCLGVLPFDNDRLCDILRGYFLKEDCGCKNPEAHRVCRIDYESDYEYVSDPEDTVVYQKKVAHSERIGVIPEFLSVIFAASIEDCIDIMKDVISHKSFDYISIDSIQGTQSEYVMGKEGNQDTMGIDAKRLTNLLRSIMHSFHQFGVESFHEMPAINIISQIRMKIGPTLAFGSYSGGKALEHEVSFIGKQARIAYLTTDGNPVTSTTKNDLCGLRIGYHNEKSKLAIPYFSGEFDLYFRDVPALGKAYGDIDYFRELMKLGIENGAITKAGGGMYVVGSEKFKGESELEKGLSTNRNLVSEICNRAPLYLPQAVEDSETPEIPEGGESVEGEEPQVEEISGSKKSKKQKK